MTIKAWLEDSTKRLEAKSIETAHLDCVLILSYCLKKSKTFVIANDNKKLPEVVTIKASQLLNQRIKNKPMAYILGEKEFYGRNFYVNNNVLIPRPETEEIVEIFKKHKLKGRVLDAGTGSGCIGLTLKVENPEISITLSDISQKALSVSKKNAKKLNIKPVRYVVSDLLEHWLLHKKPKKFDVIVANLPYVDADWKTSPEINYEPKQALFSGDGGLEYIKKLIDQSVILLQKNGCLILESDPRQQTQIETYALARGYKLIEKTGFTQFYMLQA